MLSSCVIITNIKTHNLGIESKSYIQKLTKE